MTWQEFRDWYDTLNQEEKIRVMHLIVAENIDTDLPDDHPDIQAARENIVKRFGEPSGQYFAKDLKEMPK